MTKPCSDKEVRARLIALLRRTTAIPGAVRQAGFLDAKVRVNDVRVGSYPDDVSVDGKKVCLTELEGKLLCELGRGGPAPVSRDDLYRRVLERECSPYDRSLDTHVCNLRRKLGPRKDGSARIVSARGKGYRLRSA